MAAASEVPQPLVIAPLTGDHWSGVRAAYSDGGLQTGLALGTGRSPAWEAWNALHHRHSRFAALSDGRLVGWAALAPASTRACYAGVAEIAVWVLPAARCRGIGRRLLEALVASSEANGIWTLQSTLIEGNEAAVRLQLRCGFRLVGRRHRVARLGDAWRDTLLTERRSAAVA